MQPCLMQPCVPCSIIINADLFDRRPRMVAGGLVTTNIIGVSNNTDEAVVRAAGGAWNSGLTCSNGAPPPNRVMTTARPQDLTLEG